MSAFTNEAAVRLKFQISDEVLAPASLIADAISEAHASILRILDPGVNTSAVPDALIVGETLLAGARLFRALAGKCAANRVDISVGGQRIARGNQFNALLGFAREADIAAWEMLEPYVKAAPSAEPAQITDSTEILG